MVAEAVVGPVGQLGKHHELEWVRPPRQARSLKTLERLLDSAEKLITEKGFEAVSVAGITRAARCSVGVFYSRFRDKAELLRCLHERIVGEAIETAQVALEPARWSGVEIADIVRSLVGFLVRIHTEREQLVLAFALNARTDPELGARVFFMRGELDRLCAGLIEQRIDEIAHPQPFDAASFAMDLVFDVLHRRALFAQVVPEEVNRSEHQVIEELVRVVVGYLGVRRALEPS